VNDLLDHDLGEYSFSKDRQEMIVFNPFGLIYFFHDKMAAGAFIRDLPLKRHESGYCVDWYSGRLFWAS
jgi:hypothetical protein